MLGSLRPVREDELVDLKCAEAVAGRDASASNDESGKAQEHRKGEDGSSKAAAGAMLSVDFALLLGVIDGLVKIVDGQSSLTLWYVHRHTATLRTHHAMDTLCSNQSLPFIADFFSPRLRTRDAHLVPC